MSYVKPSYDPLLGQRPKLSLERRGGGHRQKHPIPKWSHQQELDRLIGKEVRVTHGEAEYTFGMLVNADAFTIQLAQKDQSVVTYFKHSIRSYQELKKA